MGIMTLHAFPFLDRRVNEGVFKGLLKSGVAGQTQFTRGPGFQLKLILCEGREKGKHQTRRAYEAKEEGPDQGFHSRSFHRPSTI